MIPFMANKIRGRFPKLAARCVQGILQNSSQDKCARTGEQVGVLAGAVAQVILFANEFRLVQDVELFTGGQLLVAYDAREAVEVKHFASGLPDEVSRGDDLRAASALCAVPSAQKERSQCTLH